MIRPVPSVGMYGSAAWVQLNAPITWVSNSSRNDSWERLGNIAGRVTPALLIRMCSAPSASPAAFFGDTFGDSAGRIFVDVCDEHCGTRRGECVGHRRTDATGRAGDQRRPPGEVEEPRHQ